MRPLPLAATLGLAVLLAAWWRSLGWLVRLAGLALIAGLAFYAAGMIGSPDVEQIMRDLGSRLGAWTYLVVGALAFLETGAFVGLVAPGETAVLAGGVIAGQGVIDVVPLLVLVWVCSAAGDSVSFWLGRRLGREGLLRHGPRVRITEDRLQEVERFFERRGGPAILIGRFVGFARPIVPFVAGASRMPYRTFLVFDIPAAGLWSATFVLLGWASWRNFDRAAQIASRGTLFLGLAVLAGVLGLMVARWLRTPEDRQRFRRDVLGRLVGRTRHNGAR